MSWVDIHCLPFSGLCCSSCSSSSCSCSSFYCFSCSCCSSCPLLFGRSSFSCSCSFCSSPCTFYLYSYTFQQQALLPSQPGGSNSQQGFYPHFHSRHLGRKHVGFAFGFVLCDASMKREIACVLKDNCHVQTNRCKKSGCS